jgi:hypothetical protein
MTWKKLLLTGLVALLVAFGLGYAWGASGRSAAESALVDTRRQIDLAEARGRLLEARVSLYNLNFGDASRSLEEAKTPLRRLRQRHDDDDRRDAVTAVDAALQHVEEAQRLAGKLDQAANSRTNDAVEALKGVPR